MNKAAFLILGLCMSAPLSARATAAQMMDMADRGLRAAAQHWNVNATLDPGPGNILEASGSGTVKVPPTALGEVVANVPDPEIEPVVAWVMAHEVWHLVQYRGGYDRLRASQSERRLKECEADVMAAHSVIDAGLVSRREQPTERTGDELAAVLAQIIGTVGRLEENINGAGDHPPGEARLLAVRTGSGRAVADRVYDLSQDPSRGFLRDRLRHLHDIRPQEEPGRWAGRICRLLLHEGDGVASIALNQPTIRWNTSGDPPVVDFVLPYRNAGTDPLRVTMQIRSASVPRTNPGARTKWTFADAQSVDFDLQPGATYEVRGRLDWYATDELMPRLIYPKRDGSFFDAVKIPASGAPAAPTNLDMTPELTELKARLQDIFTAGHFKFRPVSRNCQNEQSYEICELTVSVPGTISGEVTRESDGSSEVELVLYEGTSEVDAANAYRDFHRRLRTIYPAVAFEESSRPDGRQYTTLRPPSSAAEVEMTKRVRNNGRYIVYVTITPNLL